jgi:uncharacterized NAD-dependent epimerase/dehydratase family protein
MVLCTRPDRTCHHDHPDCPIPPLNKLIMLYESALDVLHPAKVVAVAVNTHGMSDDDAKAAVAKAAEQTGLPATDPVRYGCDALLKAVV